MLPLRGSDSPMLLLICRRGGSGKRQRCLHTNAMCSFDHFKHFPRVCHRDCIFSDTHWLCKKTQVSIYDVLFFFYYKKKNYTHGPVKEEKIELDSPNSK